jgi:hypothetical protein
MADPSQNGHGGGKPVESTMAVRLAAEALRYLSVDPGRTAAFRQHLLDTGGENPLGISRSITEALDPALLGGAQAAFIMAMRREGYE